MSQRGLSYAAIFISDIHLGMPGIHARELLEFLENVDADQIFVLGDMIDELRLKRKSSPVLIPDHMAILETLSEKELKGSEVLYFAGNHEPTAGKSGELPAEALFTDPKGRTFHIRHGDSFGPFNGEPSEAATTVGLKVYEFMIAANNMADRASQTAFNRHFSAVTSARKRADLVVRMIGKFENAAAKSVAGQPLEGIICGHIHYPAHKESNGKIYANTGDWVEHCTALAVTHDGQWEQFDWREKRRSLQMKASVEKPREQSRKNARALFERVLG